MYELPSLEEVTECIITRDSVIGEGSPTLLRDDGSEFVLMNGKTSA
jgi:ATP-dependent Clp protease ATP-binding subunit ClpX